MRRGVRFGLSNGDPISESRPTGDSEYGESTRAPAVGVSASPALKRNIFFAGLHAMQSHQLEAGRHVKPPLFLLASSKKKLAAASTSCNFWSFALFTTTMTYSGGLNRMMYPCRARCCWRQHCRAWGAPLNLPRQVCLHCSIRSGALYLARANKFL